MRTLLWCSPHPRIMTQTNTGCGGDWMPARASWLSNRSKNFPAIVILGEPSSSPVDSRGYGAKCGRVPFPLEAGRSAWGTLNGSMSGDCISQSTNHGAVPGPPHPPQHCQTTSFCGGDDGFLKATINPYPYPIQMLYPRIHTMNSWGLHCSNRLLRQGRRSHCLPATPVAGDLAVRLFLPSDRLSWIAPRSYIGIPRSASPGAIPPLCFCFSNLLESVLRLLY